ncbi:MAG TPA: DedA family protein [Candidatus Dormibacteraeota bacterium]|nr:DedA family protein [Candidatus Dormibacteraeota bacterium]
MHWIVDTIRYYLLAWGYGAIVIGLVGEDSGLPLPGETVLFFASFLAFKGEYFSLPWVIVVGALSSAAGDNIGYLFGRKAGRRLRGHWRSILRITDRDLAGGEELMRKHGALAIFLARWIWGFRIMAGPLAGILEMAWTRFTIFNLLGAATWACTIASLGFLFGRFTTIYGFFEKVDLTLTAAVAVLSAYWWHRYRSRIRMKPTREQR